MGKTCFKVSTYSTRRNAAMVKWYNETLPRFSREFDSPWPHKEKDPLWVFFDCGQGESNGLRYEWLSLMPR